MAVVVGRMLAVLEAQTAQFTARFDAAAQQIHRFGGTTTSAHRGVTLLRGGLQQLAFQAAGVSGPVGKLSAGLLTIGAGGGPALIAAAGIGAVVGAVRLFTSAARESVRATDEMIQSLSKLGAHGKITAGQLRINQLEQLRDTPGLWERIKRIPGAFLGDITGGLAGTTAEERREQINRKIAQERREMAEAGVGLELTREEVARRRSLARIVPEGPPNFVTGEQLFARDQARMRERLFIDITRQEASRFRIAPTQEMTAPEGGFQLTPQFATMAAMAMMQVGQGGGAGQFLTAAAGPLALINPWAGAMASVMGTIFGSGGDEERRHREEMEELRRVVENTKKRGQPDRVAAYLVVNGKEIALALLPDLVYGIRRMERTRAEPILPPS